MALEIEKLSNAELISLMRSKTRQIEVLQRKFENYELKLNETNEGLKTARTELSAAITEMAKRNKLEN